MPALSFRHKILLLLASCMCLAQLITMLATLATTETTVRDSVNEDLKVAERTFDQLFEQRFYQLSASVQVLVDDFGFRAALASQDGATIISALENHAARADASMALYLDLQGAVIAGTTSQQDWAAQPGWLAIRDDIVANDYLLAAVTLQNTPYQVVAVPVMAPAKIGWVMMGFAIDDAVAAGFRELTGLHISVYDPANLMHNAFVSTLAGNHEQQLLTFLNNVADPATLEQNYSEVVLNDENFLTRLHLLAGSASPLFVVLQKSLEQELAPYHAMEQKLVLLFAAVLLGAIAAGLGIGGNIIAPIRKLALQAERIGAGNYAVEIRTDSKDEIGQLGATLNTMQQEIARREFRIVHQTQHDDLTDLPNRYLVRDRIETAINRAQRGNSRFTVVMLDIARFKKINDTLGHHIGDVLLKETANRLVRRQRKSDTAARMGGDDFLLLLENTDLDTSLHLVRNEILPLLTSPHHLDEMEISVKFTCGFAEYPTHADNPASLLRRCEIALYEAKLSHAGSAVYEEGHDEGHLRELAIVSDIDTAMEKNHLKLYVQPKLDLVSGELHQAEALVRWIHPTYGFLPPDEFIPVLEQTGNIGKLTGWVIMETARYCWLWMCRGIDITVSLNLSALDLLEPDLLAQINKAVNDFRLSPANFILEVTESAVIHDPQAARAVLQQLEAAGYRIAIDDFGTGYSSLAQLKSLPVSELKIDKSFVLNLTSSSQDAVIVKSTIDLAHSMNLQVVAEGIETEDSMNLLQEFGCDIGQGYFISKPMPAADFENWYLANRERFIPSRRNAA